MVVFKGSHPKTITISISISIVDDEPNGEDDVCNVIDCNGLCAQSTVQSPSQLMVCLFVCLLGNVFYWLGLVGGRKHKA